MSNVPAAASTQRELTSPITLDLIKLLACWLVVKPVIPDGSGEL